MPKTSLEDLYPKTLSVVQYMARTLIGLRLEDQLPTTQAWMAATAAGTGTVQAGLGILERAGAIEVSSHGAQGSILLGRRLDRLLEFSGLPPLVGALPLPYSLEFQGLATALEREFRAQHLPVRLVFVNGSRVRFEGLLHGHWDFVVASRKAAEDFSRIQEVETLRRFSAGTYYAENSVGILKRIQGAEPIRVVGRDESSADHLALSEAEFSEVQWVDVPYGQLPWVIHRGNIDGAIWHTTALTPIGIMDNLTMVPLQQNTTRQLAEQMNEAVLVGRRDAAVVKPIVAALRTEPMEATLAQVSRGEEIPFYG